MELYRQILLVAVPATVLLAAFLGIIMVRRMLKPVHAMARTAREIEEKDLSRRISVQTQDELGQLAARSTRPSADCKKLSNANANLRRMLRTN